MKNILIVLIIFFFSIGCKKSGNEQGNIVSDIKLSGNFIEITPNKSRTELTFSGNQVEITKDSGSSSDKFNYQINGDKITLISTLDSSQQTTLFFKMVDNSKFEIGNLYIHIPEDYSTMTFEK